MTQIRTRIAPSPTGDPHVGTAYIALFNRCFAHSQGGKFILRIEDTDQSRSTAQSEQDILSSLRWLGIEWDEGPDCGGEYGPYRQSQRSDIYRQHIETLLANGSAFRCFCSSERLDALRRQQMQEKRQTGYDGHCLSLTQAEVDSRVGAGEESVVRMAVPREGDCRFNDLLRGEVAIAWSQIDMQILIKSDGLPTYHFANVVDDHLMGISHVIRGEEWINSTPKHLLLYEYFGWEAPRFCHMPLLRNPDKSKLSKRKNPTSINYYRSMGYLPQALVNYLGMMGWSMPDGAEKFTLTQMTRSFDISRVSLGGPIFDLAKLDWLNGKYLREDFAAEDFIAAYASWAFPPDKLAAIVPLIMQRVDKFSDVAELAKPLVSGELPLEAGAFEHKQLAPSEVQRVLQFSLWRLESLADWQRDSIEAALQGLAAAMELKIRDFLFPLFVAMSGKPVSLSVIEAIRILGLDITRARLRSALSAMGGVSKKQLKLLQQEFHGFSWP